MRNTKCPRNKDEAMTWQEEAVMSGSEAASTHEGRRGFYTRYSRANEMDDSYDYESGQESIDDSWIYDAQ
jgi:hypothetical protein